MQGTLLEASKVFQGRLCQPPYDSCLITEHIQNSLCPAAVGGNFTLEIYKENFDVSSEGPSSGVRNSPYIFHVVAPLPTKACSFDWHYLHWQIQFKIIPEENPRPGTPELGGGGAGGAAAPVALYQEGQGGQRCPFNLKDCLGEIANGQKC